MTIQYDQAQTDRVDGLTSQLAVSMVGNRYDLVLIAAQRAKELRGGDLPKVVSKHGPVLTALKEIEQGKVGREYLLKLAKAPERRREY
jgi:DNA-directed RNA polymerase subunit omega